MIKFSNIPQLIASFWKFLTEDLWRVSAADIISAKRRRSYNFLKVITLSLRRFQEDNLQNRASALTYSSLLSIVPLLAVLFSIAKGFGFNNIIESQLFDYFLGQKEALVTIFAFIDSYMEQAKGGVFVGIGIILLLYTVLNLISSIESAFNKVWQVNKGRSYYRQITDYFSFFLLFPVFLICSSGISIFMSTIFETLKEYEELTPVFQSIMNFAPWMLTIFAFTFLYIFVPNTKVHFRHAFYAGIVAGTGFQIFQYLYINGQIWVSKYNAIYGSFAVLPLLLLWLQLSWVICLLGAEIAYASQNIHSYEYEADCKNISRRYNDFLTLLILTLIVKRFMNGEKGFTPEEISVSYKIPIRQTHIVLFYLCELHLINEIKDENEASYYQPALDINQITIGFLLSKIDTHGSENFQVDKEIEFQPEWEAILKSRKDMYSTENQSILLKNL